MSFDESASPLVWTADGIYFGALRRTYAHLYRVDPTTAVVTRISQPDGLIGSQFSIAQNVPEVAYVGATDNTFPEVYVSALSNFSPKALTNLSSQLAAFRPAHRERISGRRPMAVPRSKAS